MRLTEDRWEIVGNLEGCETLIDKFSRRLSKSLANISDGNAVMCDIQKIIRFSRSNDEEVHF